MHLVSESPTRTLSRVQRPVIIQEESPAIEDAPRAPVAKKKETGGMNGIVVGLGALIAWFQVYDYRSNHICV